MKDFFVFSILAFSVLSGCSSRVAPNCAKHPDILKLDSAERLALANALVRFGERCKRHNYQCDISLIRNSRKEILVTIASVRPDRRSGHCLRAHGDQDLAAYRPDGMFVERVMSL